jgi:hypothetical protein
MAYSLRSGTLSSFGNTRNQLQDEDEISAQNSKADYFAKSGIKHGKTIVKKRKREIAKPKSNNDFLL